MATLDLEIGGYRYALACRDGEEQHLRDVAALVDARTTDAVRAMGGMNEARQLLFAALMLADELEEARSARPAAPAPALAERPPEPDPRLLDALDRVAARLEALADAGESADGLEAAPANA